MNRGLIRLAESCLIPDRVIRLGIGLLNRKRLRLEEAGSAEFRQKKKNDFIEGLKRSPIVLQPEKPREQHYELPPGRRCGRPEHSRCRVRLGSLVSLHCRTLPPLSGGGGIQFGAPTKFHRRPVPGKASDFG